MTSPKRSGQPLQAALVFRPASVIVEHVGHRHRAGVEHHVERRAGKLGFVGRQAEFAPTREHRHDGVAEHPAEAVLHDEAAHVGERRYRHTAEEAQVVEVADDVEHAVAEAIRVGRQCVGAAQPVAHRADVAQVGRHLAMQPGLLGLRRALPQPLVAGHNLLELRLHVGAPEALGEQHVGRHRAGVHAGDLAAVALQPRLDQFVRDHEGTLRQGTARCGTVGARRPAAGVRHFHVIGQATDRGAEDAIDDLPRDIA